MPTVSQAIVFNPHRQLHFSENGVQRSTIKTIPSKEIYNNLDTSQINVDLQLLNEIPNKSSTFSLFAKLFAIAAGVGIIAGITAGVTAGVLSRKAATTTTIPTTVGTSSTTTATIANYVSRDIFWSFDNNALDLYNNYPANTYGSPTYTTSYLGTGAALSLTRSSSQYAAFTTPQLVFGSSSFTIEVWIYPISLSTSDYGIFGQCQSATTNLCMFFIVRNLALYCGFWNNDLSGSTTLTMNTWSHVACVYNLATQTQQIWLNGVLDTSRSSTPYVGVSGDTTIGVGYLTPPGSNFFNGYFDQMQFTFRAKNSTEILNDATLVVYYPFDSGSLYDYGPNGINATASGTPTTVSGRVNQAIQFSSGAYVTQSYPGFYMLGVSGQPFTLSIWVQPIGSLAQSSIVFAHEPTGWCVSLITTQSNGQVLLNAWGGYTVTVGGPILSLNTWTHIGYTYSVSNGMLLYINGTQYATSGSFTIATANTPLYVTVGSNYGSNGCSPSYGGSFNGAVDEFYVFCRELSASQIFALANP